MKNWRASTQPIITRINGLVTGNHETRIFNNSKNITALENLVKGNHESRIYNNSKDISALSELVKGNHESRIYNNSKDIIALNDLVKGNHETRIYNNSKDIKVLNDSLAELKPIVNDQKYLLLNHEERILNNSKAVKLNSDDLAEIKPIVNDQKYLLLNHENRILNNSNEITSMKKQIDNLSIDFSDVGIIAAIVKASSDNLSLWDTSDYETTSISEKDGKAVKLIKSQFQGLKTHISSMDKAYFGEDGIFTKIFQSVLKRPTDLLKIIADKNLFVIPEEGLKILGLKENFDKLMLVLNTLVNLIQKNTDEFVAIGFKESLSRLERLLQGILDKKIKLEDVTNTFPEINLSEKGNGWLKQLIKTAGDIIETAIKSMSELLGKAIDGVAENLGKLIDLVGGLLDKFLKLIVPENLDFMDHKFDSTSKTIKLKFSFIFEGIDSFKGILGSKSVFKDIDVSLGTFGNGSFKLPISMLNDLAPYVKALITGAVALEFLIDMYKWFHTRGEVIE
ncbi:hypothetical protein [Enterococcus gilvus]|uniref:hypothetical protein n=1 Tax=Enterococcus gilvus TaxID=160453 RepID=UPI00345EC8E4